MEIPAKSAEGCPRRRDGTRNQNEAAGAEGKSRESTQAHRPISSLQIVRGRATVHLSSEDNHSRRTFASHVAGGWQLRGLPPPFVLLFLFIVLFLRVVSSTLAISDARLSGPTHLIQRPIDFSLPSRGGSPCIVGSIRSNWLSFRPRRTPRMGRDRLPHAILLTGTEEPLYAARGMVAVLQDAYHGDRWRRIPPGRSHGRPAANQRVCSFW